MGGFMSLSALRLADTEAVVEALLRFGAAHDVPARRIDRPAGVAADVACVWAAAGEWSTVSWPDSYHGGTAAGRWLSDRTDALVSCVEVYDGDFWLHVLWRGGLELDRFASVPDYFTDERRRVKQLKQEWAGHPDVVAAACGVAVEQVAPYLIHPYSSGFFGRMLAGRRPLPDDEFVLGDFWVFTDFWKRLGITYAQGPPARAGHFAGKDKLPADGPSL